MNKVMIIVEGQTEEKFCKEILFPYFYQKGYYILDVMILPTKILASGERIRGGYVTSDRVVEFSKKLLGSRCFVTTLLDYYGINNNFIGYQESLSKNTLIEKKECIENALKTEIDNHVFFPYIQMHEFEALLFSDVDSFESIEDDFKKIEKIKKEVTVFETPEHINNSRDTAPSKRILKHIKGYIKTTDGMIIANKIGIEKMMSKCPLFKAWLEKIEENLKKVSALNSLM